MYASLLFREIIILINYANCLAFTNAILIFLVNFLKIAINSILLASINIRINIINSRIIKNKIVFSYAYDIRF